MREQISNGGRLLPFYSIPSHKEGHFLFKCKLSPASLAFTVWVASSENGRRRELEQQHRSDSKPAGQFPVLREPRG